MRGLGYEAVGLDFATASAWDDIDVAPGCCKALLCAMSLRGDGLLWAAPPCSSWVWLSRGSTGR
eukprot:3554106-Pyramimonas_sp.AAC.1